jgi:hypothetical protein
MSCDNTTNCNCENNPCGCKISSDDVAYQGPDLACTGIETCDSLTVAIQKLTDYACGIDMVQNIIYNITNNIALYEQFLTIVNQSVDCETVFNCLASTTTTTTTIAPTCYCVEIIINQDDLDAATGNTNPALDGKVYLSGYLGSACDGGDLDRTYSVEDAYKFCVTIADISLLALYYYKNDDVVTGGSLSSVIINLVEDCSETGDCFDPTTTTTTTIEPTTTTTTTTITPTTTSTTTVVNFEHGFSEGKADNLLACAETVVAITLYTSVPTIVFGTFVYTDPGLTIPFNGGVLFYKNISVNNGIRTSVTGQVNNLFSC